MPALDCDGGIRQGRSRALQSYQSSILLEIFILKIIILVTNILEVAQQNLL
jgi:hypothetical protein